MTIALDQSTANPRGLFRDIAAKIEAFEAAVRLPALTAEGLFREVHGTRPDPWQRAYLQRALLERSIAIVACRQSGKSTIVSVFAAWMMLYCPPFKILVSSKSLRQAAEFMQKVRAALEQFVPARLWPQANQLSIQLPNGSFCVAVPARNAHTARGYSPDLVLMDEAAFAPAELFQILSPSLGVTGGALHMISSPNGRQGFFYEACEGRAASTNYTLRVTADECPRISPEWLANERLRLGELAFLQEYYAQFILMEGAFFSDDVIRSLETGEGGYHEDFTIEDEETRISLEAEVDDMKAAFDTANRVMRTILDD